MARGQRHRRKEPDSSHLDEIVDVAFEHPVLGVIGAMFALVAAGVVKLVTPVAEQPIGSIGALLFVLLAVAGLLAAAAGAARRILTGGRTEPGSENVPATAAPYRRTDALLSPGELAFYEALVHSTPPRITILAKVRLMDLLHLPGNTPSRSTWVKRAAQKHVDFVICHRSGLRPFLVIELDDRSHRTANGVRRDTFVNESLRQAGWPIERVVAQQAYDVVELGARVGRHAGVNLQRKGTGRRELD